MNRQHAALGVLIVVVALVGALVESLRAFTFAACFVISLVWLFVALRGSRADRVSGSGRNVR